MLGKSKGLENKLFFSEPVVAYRSLKMAEQNLPVRVSPTGEWAVGRLNSGGVNGESNE